MHPLLSYLINHKSKTLSGNKESYSIIEYINGKIYFHGGDTFPYEETFRYDITEEETISKLKEYFSYKCEIFSVSYPEDENLWEEFLKENWYL